jgi:hypothetical protein
MKNYFEHRLIKLRLIDTTADIGLLSILQKGVTPSSVISFMESLRIRGKK